jgi:hypothetical protein
MLEDMAVDFADGEKGPLFKLTVEPGVPDDELAQAFSAWVDRHPKMLEWRAHMQKKHGWEFVQ